MVGYVKYSEEFKKAIVEKYLSKSENSESIKERELEKELNRKDKELSETAALLVLKKKPRQSGGSQRKKNKF